MKKITYILLSIASLVIIYFGYNKYEENRKKEELERMRILNKDKWSDLSAQPPITVTDDSIYSINDSLLLK